MQPIQSTGFVKVGENYINPYHITHVCKNENGTTFVGYDLYAQGPLGIGPTADNIPVDCNKFAKCAVKAMQTGEIVDVMA